MSVRSRHAHNDIAFGWHLMHERIFANVLPYQYSLDFETSFETLPTDTDDLLRYVHFVKEQREHWRSNWWLKIQLTIFGFLRNIWLMLLMVNTSTLLIYTGMMSYFYDSAMAFPCSFLFVANIFVAKHSIHWLKKSTSKHYALSKLPVLVCATGWLIFSIRDFIELDFFSIKNLPTMASMWIVTMIGAKSTRLEAPLMNTLAFVFLCGIFVIGFDELAYISRGYGANSYSRIIHQESELAEGLWGFQMLYTLSCILTTLTMPQNKQQI